VWRRRGMRGVLRKEVTPEQLEKKIIYYEKLSNNLMRLSFVVEMVNFLIIFCEKHQKHQHLLMI
jgi:hypothetical protein